MRPPAAPPRYRQLADTLIRDIEAEKYRVGALGHLAPEAVESGNVDDPAPFALLHVRDGVSCQIKSGREIRLEHRIPVFQRNIEKRLFATQADIRDGDVHRSELGHGLLDQPGHRVMRRNIRHDAQRFTSAMADLRDHRIDRLPVAVTVDHDVGAALGQGQSDGAPDVSAGAGDDCRAAGK